jgi:hypothetical protein
MEDKLRNLKNEMDSKVFNDIPFNRNASIKSVLEGTERTGDSMKRYSLKRMFPEVMGVLVCAVILFVLVNVGIDYYSGSETDAGKEDSFQQSESKVENKTPEELDFPDSLEEYNVIEGDYSNFPHIVFNGFYYLKTVEVEKDKIGEVIGEVKRIGDWEIKKDGDSNEVPPGSIYSVIDRDPSEVIAAKQWSNRDVYVLFEKAEQIKKIDLNTIFSAKNDPEEVRVAIENIRKHSLFLYEFTDKERLELFSVSYDPNHRTLVSQGYKVAEADTDVVGILNVLQYPKDGIPISSKFSKDSYRDKVNKKEWISPQLEQEFQVGDIKWGKYITFTEEIIYKGEVEDICFEISTQGDFSLNLIKDLTENFDKTN